VPAERRQEDRSVPTYQYACKDCDHHFEQVQAFSDPSLTVCPSCGGHLRKVYGSVGVVFKGSGFYRTDSRSGSGKASLTADHKAESSNGSASGSDSSSSSGSASSPAPKPAAPAKAAASTSPKPSTPVKAAV
jgi:putative FmdB family regulatory protein